MLNKNGKEYLTAFIGSAIINLVLMMIYYYLHVKQGVFSGFDIPRYTTVAIVLTPVIAGVICYFRHKKDDDRTGLIFPVALISFAAAFLGSILGAVIAANIFGK